MALDDEVIKINWTFGKFPKKPNNFTRFDNRTEEEKRENKDMAAGNLIQLQGRLTRDPETRQAGKATVTSFSVAVNDSWDREKAYFFDCEAWNKKGEFIQNHFKKGEAIVVQGELTQSIWEDDDGNNRRNTRIKCEDVTFALGGSRSDSQESLKPKGGGLTPADENLGVDDIPF